MCHFISCIWIFIAKQFNKKDESNPDATNWIEAGGFEEFEMWQLYISSFYFSVTTITTVGYGDISGTNTTEYWMCFFLHLIGVLSYSFAAGSLTMIIQNYDQINNKHQDKIITLNRLYKEAKFPEELYFNLKDTILNNYDQEDQ